MTYMANRIRHLGTSIFAEMTALANQHQAVNLGQGFPDFATPDFLKAAAREAIDADINQYAPSNGRFRLREAIAKKVEHHYRMTVDPDTQIAITTGATEALFAAILGLVNPGDEVIIFEPFYDSYLPAIQMAGGIPQFYTLRPPDWGIEFAELQALFSNNSNSLYELSGLTNFTNSTLLNWWTLISPRVSAPYDPASLLKQGVKAVYLRGKSLSSKTS